LHESAPARAVIRSRRLILMLAVASLTLLASAGRARANGALPASYGILLPADKPQEIVLATNFGMIISDDGGKSWLWTCEQPQTNFGYLYGVGPSPRDRFYGLSPDQGLALSDDGSCTWQRAGGVLSNLVASDFFVDRTNGDRVLAVAASIDTATGDIGTPSIFVSADAGTTFGSTPLYAAQAGGNIVSIEIARSNPQVVYAAMYLTPDRHPHLLRSDDAGQTWMDRNVEAGLGANEFRILAVDPADADTLYLRVIAAGMEHLAVTRDAGATFAMPVTITGPNGGALSAFLRMESGTVLVGGYTNIAGGGMNGVAYRSTDGGNTFGPWTLSPQPHILGLAERGGVLYVAGKNYSDNWALATSHDEGVTIQPLSSYSDVRGIKPCAMAMCGDACMLVASQAVWTNDVCTYVAPPPPPPPSSSGCHCAAVADAAPRGTVVACALVGAAVAIRRRRRRG
jgi:photosystem II stability/assembly factor-like uncharacterized protein